MRKSWPQNWTYFPEPLLTPGSWPHPSCPAHLVSTQCLQGDFKNILSRAPGWFSWLSLRLWLRACSLSLWVRAPYQSHCCQQRACFGSSVPLSLWPSPTGTLSFSLKINKLKKTFCPTFLRELVLFTLGFYHWKQKCGASLLISVYEMLYGQVKSPSGFPSSFLIS